MLSLKTPILSLLILLSLGLYGCSSDNETAIPTASAAAPTTPQVSSEKPSQTEQTPPSVEPVATSPKKEEKKAADTKFETIDWTALIPKEDLDALMNPPSYITDVEDGSMEDQISNQLQNTIVAAKDDKYQQALSSTRIVAEMNGKSIRIPGFIVPLEFKDDQTITQFFVVPFFGACIHVPPPPPNQIIFVDYPKGLKLGALYDPFWISGVLHTSITENDLATAAYRLELHKYETYIEE